MDLSRRPLSSQAKQIRDRNEKSVFKMALRPKESGNSSSTQLFSAPLALYNYFIFIYAT